ncbi:MAG TPA: FHA domain-containing protein [Solirubrobacteraceae bacterium]|nr:FHA domain-containing protein [Solirubrobacteraceae bacterium]
MRELLEANRAGVSLLVFRDGEGTLRIFPLADSERVSTVGRHPDMDVAISWDGEVSGLHAELRCLGGAWTIVDDGLSTNGTFINSHRVAGRQRLRHDDRIRLGRTVIVFKANAPRTENTVAAGAQPLVKQLSDTQRRVLIALCRPYRNGNDFATPATNQQIAAELYLSVDAIKTHLRTLFGKLELGELPQNQKRAKLAERALQLGLISQRDLD